MAKNRKTPDMNLPMWFDGQNINEALFCEEFLQERRIIFANGAFFTPDGRVTDDLPLRGEIYDKLKFCAVNNIPRKITNILEVLKLEAQVPDFPPEQDRIHVSNGTVLLDGTFTKGRPTIVRSRLPVAYNPDATAPVIWLNFLDGLLHAEDIPTLQEFIGYCLIPSNKGQRMMVIKGNGGEGKSQIGAVLSAIFGTNMKDGSIGKISENRFARADLEHILLCVDDDMRMEALRQTNYVKSIVTAHVETVVLLSHKKPDGHINVKVEFGEGEGKVPLDNIAKRAESYKPKERVTYKMVKEYIEVKYGFKVHTAYIAEVKRDLGLPMYDAPNAVEELKQPRKHPTAEKVEAIKDALKHFEVI